MRKCLQVYSYSRWQRDHHTTLIVYLAVACVQGVCRPPPTEVGSMSDPDVEAEERKMREVLEHRAGEGCFENNCQTDSPTSRCN